MIAIRPAIEADAETLVSLVQELADFHGSRPAATIAPEDVLAHEFGPNPLVRSWVAEDGDGQAVGFVQVYRGYAAWQGSPLLIVANLYVDAGRRTGGIGRRLMREAARYGLDTGCRRLERFVADRNPALAFYQKLGMRVVGDHRCRLEAAGLEALAAKPAPPA